LLPFIFVVAGSGKFSARASIFLFIRINSFWGSFFRFFSTVGLNFIEKERGQHFDPIVADAFLDNIDEFLKIKDEVGADGDVPLPGL
jgi:hypothetical protein